jgi:hypothetical protein
MPFPPLVYLHHLPANLRPPSPKESPLDGQPMAINLIVLDFVLYANLIESLLPPLVVLGQVYEEIGQPSPETI